MKFIHFGNNQRVKAVYEATTMLNSNGTTLLMDGPRLAAVVNLQPGESLAREDTLQKQEESRA